MKIKLLLIIFVMLISCNVTDSYKHSYKLKIIYTNGQSEILDIETINHYKCSERIYIKISEYGGAFSGGRGIIPTLVIKWSDINSEVISTNVRRFEILEYNKPLLLKERERLCKNN